MQPTKSSRTVRLTPREIEVLKLVAAGLNTKQIAQSLQISPRTVEGYIAHVRARLNAANRIQLIAMAVKEGYL